MKIAVRWLLLAAALLLVAQIYAGVAVTSFGSALIAALVLGLLNALLRPILVLLTLPVTVVTLGLFLFVINALMFYFAASVLDGFNVTGFGAALIGSLLYSLCGLVIDVALERIFERRGVAGRRGDPHPGPLPQAGEGASPPHGTFLKSPPQASTTRAGSMCLRQAALT